jgi:hypothetical protein
MVRKAHVPPAVAILTIFLVSSGDFMIVLGHLLAQFDGVVVARTEDVHYPPWTRTRATRYIIRDTDGHQHLYYADSSEGGLDGFPDGTSLKKHRWQFEYEENGQVRNDFPFPFYLLFLILDTGLLVGAVVLAIMMRNRDRRNRELADAVDRGRRLLESER